MAFNLTKRNKLSMSAIIIVASFLGSFLTMFTLAPAGDYYPYEQNQPVWDTEFCNALLESDFDFSNNLEILSYCPEIGYELLFDSEGSLPIE